MGVHFGDEVLEIPPRVFRVVAVRGQAGLSSRHGVFEQPFGLVHFFRAGLSFALGAPEPYSGGGGAFVVRSVDQLGGHFLESIVLSRRPSFDLSEL